MSCKKIKKIKFKNKKKKDLKNKKLLISKKKYQKIEVIIRENRLS